MSTEFEDIITKSTPLRRALGQGLETIHDHPDADVDILAVPGLGANPHECWTWDSGAQEGSVSADKAGISETVRPKNGPKKNFNWLKDEHGLAELFPRSRIMLYDYASAWRGKRKVRVSMKGICTWLLDDLHDRRKDGSETRPLIFIAHSMGGIVVAKALRIAKTRKEWESIVTHTTGCAFFGVPFRGSDMAKIALMYSSIFGNEAYEALITLMRSEKNDALDEVTSDFMEICNKLTPPMDLVCVWEQLPTVVSYSEKIAKRLPGLLQQPIFKAGVRRFIEAGFSVFGTGTHFVEKESAELQGAYCVGMTAGHSDLIKFESITSTKFGPVKSALTRMVQSARPIARKRALFSRDRLLPQRFVNQVRRSLEGIDMRSKFRTEVDSQRVTSWLTSEPIYQQWLQPAGSTSPEHSHLWLKGGAGLGKTRASLAAIQQLNHFHSIRRPVDSYGHSEAFLAYFLCDRFPVRSTAEDVLKNLIIQLINQDESLAQHARWFVPNPSYRGPAHLDLGRASNDKGVLGAKATATVENLWKCLHDMVDDSVVNSIHFVVSNIHNLDSGASTKALLSNLAESSFPSEHWPSARVKWLLTSRNDAHICEALSAGSISVIDLENDIEYGVKVKFARQSHARDAIARLGSAKNYNRDLTYYIRNFVKGQSEDEKWIDILCLLLQARPNDNDLSIRKWLRNAGKFSVPALVDFAWETILNQNQDAMLEIEELMQVLTIVYEPPSLHDVAVLADIDEIQWLIKLIEKCSPILQIVTSGEDKGKIVFTNPEFRKEIAITFYGTSEVPSQQKKRFHGLMALRCFKHIRASYDLIDGPDYVPELPTSLLSHSAITASLQNEAVTRVAMLQVDSEETSSISSRSSKDNCQYPTRHLFRHLSEGPSDAAQELCEDDPYFWGESSTLRDQWLKDFQRLTTEFKDLKTSGMSALHVAAGIGATDLLASFVDRNGKQSLSWTDESGKTPLHIAAYNNHSDAVDRLIRSGAQIEAGEREAGTPLHLAALRGHCSIMKLLIDQGANINAFSKSIGPVINAAIRSGTVDAVKLIMDQNIEFDADYTKCDPPLSLSAGISDPNLFQEILESGKHKWLQNVKLLDQALIAAAYSGRSKSLRVLLDFEHTYINNTLETAILSAALEKHWTSVNDLLDYVIKQTSQGKRRGVKLDDTFYLAATSREEHLAVLKKIWTSTNHAIPEELLNFSLYQAAVLTKSSIVDWLLDVCGASANATAERPRSVFVNHDNALPFPDFSTALNAAAGSGSVQIVESLIRKGAEVDGHLVYALQLAAGEGHDDVVKVLLERGALVNKNLPENEELGFFSGTALQAACDNKRTRIVDTLLKHGADPNLGGGPFTNPITAATQKDEPEILRLLLHADGINVNVVGGEDLSTPLINAAAYMSVESVELLAKHGADIDARNAAGETALIMAAGRGDTVCVGMLCDEGADVTYRSPLRGLAIAAAADGLHPLCVRLLADKMGGKIEIYRERAKLDPSKERLDQVLAELELRDVSIASIKATLADTEEQLESSNDYHQHEIQKLITARSIQGENYESASQQVRAIQSERMEMQKQLDAARGHERHANDALEKVENMLKHERQINAALRKRQDLDAFKERLNDAQNSVETEKQQGLLLQENIISLQKTIVDMEAKVTSARADMAGVLRQLAAEQKSKAALKEEMQTLENRHRELVMNTVQEQPRLREATSSGFYTPHNASDAAIDRDYLRRHSDRADSGRAAGSPSMGLTPVSSPQTEGQRAMSPHMPASGPHPKIRNSGPAPGFKTIHGQHRPDGSMGGYRRDRMLRMRSDDISDVLPANEQDRELKLSPQSSISDNRSAT